MQVMIVRGGDHKTFEHGWLRTTHHFSFGEYHDPKRMRFGPLRVFNDDLIQPGSGFDFHQHRDMEIVTYVISGELEHRDNFGNTGTIREGEVQVMSAGTGVFHSEYNRSASKPLRLLQMWVFPRQKDLMPAWGQHAFSRQQRQDVLLEVISPDGGPLSINQDASFSICALGQGRKVEHKLGAGRRAYLYAIAGRLGLGDDLLGTGDSAEIVGGGTLSITGKNDSEMILIDLPGND